MRLLHAIAVVAFLFAQYAGAAQAFAGAMPCPHGQQKQAQAQAQPKMDCAKMHQQSKAASKSDDCCKPGNMTAKCCCGHGLSAPVMILTGVALPLPLPASAPEMRGIARMAAAFAPPALRPPISVS